MDSTPNSLGNIEFIVWLKLEVDGHIKKFCFAVTNTGSSDIIIRLDWLKKHNPTIDWQKGKLIFNRCPPLCRGEKMRKVWEEEDEEADHLA